MRITDVRYVRDLRAIDLAQRMVNLEARTQTICAWTGLTGDRVRNLAQSYAQLREGARHRGPSPSKFVVLMSSPRLREEAAALAGLLRVFDVIPARACAEPRRTLPEIPRGERLCNALELFQQVIPQTRMTLEQAILLTYTVAEGETWVMDWCTSCHATILVDRVAPSRRVCEYCSREDQVNDKAPGTQTPPMLPSQVCDSPFIQQDLF
jgi:hypothetical protein